MGRKGLNFTLGILGAACLMLVSASMMEWKHVSFVAGTFTADIYLFSAVFNGLAVGMLNLSKHTRLSDGDVTGNLAKVRDVFCGIPLSPFCSAMCDKFTLDLASGIITMCLFIIALVLIVVGAGYLFYHGQFQTKREYRLIAYRCLCCAPVLVLLGIFSQAISLFFTLVMGTRIAQAAYFPSVVTPGGGYFMAIFAFFLLSFAPCLSEQWTLATREVLHDERRQYRRGQKAVLFGDESYDEDEEYGAVRKDSRAFYKPSNYGSCTNITEPNNQNDPPLYPSLHQSPRYPGTEGAYVAQPQQEKNSGRFPQDFDFFFSNAQNNKNKPANHEDHDSAPHPKAPVTDDPDCPPGFEPAELPPPPGYEDPEQHQPDAIPASISQL